MVAAKSRPRAGGTVVDSHRSLSHLSVVILAGGKSSRMGEDKAFLNFGGRPFVSRIFEEMRRLTDDVLVVIGNKDERRFRDALGRGARIIQDTYNLNSPLGGMLSACDVIDSKYAAFLASDMPLVRHQVVRFLHSAARGHSCAIPMWENGDLEPLCAVYNVEEVKREGLDLLEIGEVKCKALISRLRDVKYVPVKRIRSLDPDLGSLTNVNSGKDLASLSEAGAV